MGESKKSGMVSDSTGNTEQYCIDNKPKKAGLGDNKLIRIVLSLETDMFFTLDNIHAPGEAVFLDFNRFNE